MSAWAVNFVYIAGVVFQTIVLFWFFKEFFDMKELAKKCFPLIFALCCISGVISAILGPPYLGIIYVLQNMLCVFLYNGKLLKRIFMMAMFIFIGSVSEIIGMTILELAHGIVYEAMVDRQSFANLIAVIYSNIIMLILVKLLQRFLGKDYGNYLPAKYWLGMLSMPLASIAVIFVASLQPVSVFNRFANGYVVTMVMLCYLNLAMYFILDKLNELFVTKNRMDLLEQEIRMQHEQYKQMEMTNKTIRSMRHDLKNHLGAVAGYLERGEYADAKEYINGMGEGIYIMSNLVDSGNSVIDAVLSSKLAYAQSMGINEEHLITLPENLRMEELDACSFFGNLLDNAIEGTLRSNGKRSLNLRLDYRNNTLFGRIKNSVAEKPIIDKENGFLSSKRNKSVRGIGIETIKAITQKYDGHVNFECDDNYFTVNFMLCGV